MDNYGHVRVAVIGSRTFNDYNNLSCTLVNMFGLGGTRTRITEIVSGGAKGADSLAARFARENDIHLEEFPADWGTFGKRAGYLRNVQIIDNCDEVVAFWDGESKGTKHSIDLARKKGIKVTIIRI